MPWVSMPIKNPSEKEISRNLSEFKGKARFLVDENLGIRVTEALRREGWHVKDVSEAGLTGHSDQEVFAHAKYERRILLTNDEDFWDDEQYPLKGCPGIIFLPSTENVLSLSHALGWILEGYPGVYREAKVRISKDGITTFKDPTGSSRQRMMGLAREMWVD